MSNEKQKAKVIGVEMVENLNAREVAHFVKDTNCGALLSTREEEEIQMQMVKNMIEQCLVHFMSQKEMMDILYEKENIEPSFTKTVLQHLIEHNQDYFKQYYFMLAVKHQSINHLYYPYEVSKITDHKFIAPATATTLEINRCQPGVLGLKLQATPVITLALHSAPPALDNQLSGSR